MNDDPSHQATSNADCKIEIFIAHRHKDAETAQRFKRIFEQFGSHRLCCFVSKDIPYAADWYERIRESLAKARIVVLLYTGMDKGDWAWPILEVGYATNPAKPSECKTVCFHPPGSKPPNPLQHLQAVEATQNGVADFLKKFFGTSEIIEGEPIIQPSPTTRPRCCRERNRSRMASIWSIPGNRVSRHSCISS